MLKSCGVLIVRGEPIREVLLLEHATRLDIPKGHVDPGETNLACALRELVEETGITADDVRLDPAFRFEHHYRVADPLRSGRTRDKVLIVFLGRLVRDVPIVLTEHIGYRWMDWNPPHKMQKKTIDPLLAHLAEHCTHLGPPENERATGEWAKRKR